MIYFMESMAREIALERERTGKLVTQQTCIFDVAELSMRILSHKLSIFHAASILSVESLINTIPLCTTAVEVLIETIQILESKYPEIVRSIFFINGKLNF